MIKHRSYNSLFAIHNSSVGFTIVEMILYVAIVAIFMTGMVYFTMDIVYGRVKSFTHQEVNQNIRFASGRISYEMKNAKSVNSISGSTISLEMADIDRNPTVFDISGDRLRIGYGVTGNCPVSSPCFLTSNKVVVSNLTFTDLTSGGWANIKFSITVEAQGDRREFQKSETYETSVELRSK